MAEDPRESPEDESEAPPSTPFDNPWFLPVLLWLFVAWFGWDIVTDAEAYQKYPNFNRGGLVISGLLALYYSWTASKETFLAPKDGDG
jgi:hypothetical protein